VVADPAAPPPTPVVAAVAPVAKAVTPEPVVVSRPAVVEVKKVEPQKPAEPGVSDKVAAQYQRFKNWLNWLTKTK
jgi:hypothetical protein